MSENKRALLVLEDGSCFRGYSFGASGVAEGEVVFITSMTGYQEICTDPSYHGQMVVLTYPLIGNYGVNDGDDESWRPWAAALIVREYCSEYSNWQAGSNLDDFLKRRDVPGIHGVDTRALTRHLRTHGTQRAVLVSGEDVETVERLRERARSVVPLSEKDLVADTSCRGARGWRVRGETMENFVPADARGEQPRVALLDLGVKRNIIRSLTRRGIEVVQLPHDASAETVLSYHPDGILVSPGPGDPSSLPEQVETVRALLASDIPFLGICLGHHLLGLAIGGVTGRLKFGHHGGNHPVKDLETGRVYITSQNHNFQVLAESIDRASGLEVSHINLNDGSVEGLRHRSRPVFSIQYHSEGSPGPQDNQYVFDRFVSLFS